MRTAIEVRRPGSLRQVRRPVGLGDAVTDSYQAQLQARLSSAGVQTQAQIQSLTGVDVTNARIQQGAAATVSLATSGYNPDSGADNGKLVAAIAGGVSLLLPVGPIIGGAVEALWQVGNAVGCPLTNALASIGIGTSPPECGGQRCRTSGNWTPSIVLHTGEVPAMPAGSFASFVMGALAYYASQELNCKAGMPPAVIVDGAVAIWNQTHNGPSTPIFVPPLSTLPIIPTAGSVVRNGAAIQDPNATYAFGPLSRAEADPFFRHTDPSSWGYWPPFDVPTVLNLIGQPGFTAPRVVNVNIGGAHAPLHLVRLHAFNVGPTPATSGGLSTPAKVAVGTAAVAAGVFTIGSIWAFVEHQTIGYFWGKAFDKAWEKTKEVFGK